MSALQLQLQCKLLWCGLVRVGAGCQDRGGAGARWPPGEARPIQPENAERSETRGWRVLLE